jgi:type IV pilus assembly protein PilY1
MNAKINFRLIIFYIFVTIIACIFILNRWVMTSYAGIQYKTPQVLIILDNSQSMDGDLSGAIMTGSGTATSNTSSNGFVDQSSSSLIDYNVPGGFTAPITETAGGQGVTAPYTVCSGDVCTDNSASRLNVAKAAILDAYNKYSNNVQFGLMDYGINDASTNNPSGNTPTEYTTWVYYMSGTGGFTFGTSSTPPSGLTFVKNPCSYSNTQATQSCQDIRSFFGAGNGVFSDPYLYIQDTSDESTINDVLYDSGIPTNFVTNAGVYNYNYNYHECGNSFISNIYTFYNLTNYNQGQINSCYKKTYPNIGRNGNFNTSPTNAGYVSYSPQVWYSERGFGYYNSLTGSGNLVIPIAASNSTQQSNFTTDLAPETSNSGSSEIKADAVNAPMAGTLASALSYLTGSSLPAPSCPGKKYVIFVTDGLPTYDQNGNNWPPIGSAAAAGYGVTATFNSDGSLAPAGTNDKALLETISEIADLKNKGIDTYVIGMGAGVDPSINPQAAAVLKAMAVAGGTSNFFPATTPQDVANDLGIIVQEIMASGSYTTPVIHQTTTGTNKYLYYADFEATLTQPLWGEGNIYLFQLDSPSITTLSNSTTGCPIGSGLSDGLVGPVGGPGSSSFACMEKQNNETINGQTVTVTSIIPPSPGSSSYNSFWDTPTGLGAGDALKNGDYYNTTERNVFTSYFDSATGQEVQIPINTSSSSYSNSELQTMLGTSSNYTSICGSSSTADSCTESILNFVLNPSQDGWKLGAIYHSDPVLIGAPSIAFYENPSTSAPLASSCSNTYTGSYYQFYSCEEHRQQVLAAGANDGMLHGFDAGVYGGSAYGSTSTTYGYGSGEEMFGYIPPDLLPEVSNWYQGSLTQPSSGDYPQDFFVDSTPAASDVYFNNIFDGTTPNTVSGVSTGWHTVLVSGERSGGSYYFALDMTHPSQLSAGTYPVPLWDFTDTSMGETWSRPVIGFICLPNSPNSPKNGVCSNNANALSATSSAPQYVKTYLAIAGGGYSSTGSTGNAVYALYVEPNPLPSSGPPYADNQTLWKYSMNYPVPSEVAPVFNTSGGSAVPSGELEAFYVGDLGGEMYAFSMPSIAAETVKSSSTWNACPIFTQPAANPLLNIFYPPAVSYDSSGNLWVYFGTGNRADLNEIVPDPTNPRPNEFLAANMGTATAGTCTTNTPQSSAPYTIAASASTTTGLENVTGAYITASSSTSSPSSISYSYTLNELNGGNPVSLSTANAAINPDGWYITLLNPGEKVVSSPVVYNGIVYFTTYTPNQTSNSCSEGYAQLYALNYTNGGGEVATNSAGVSILGTSQSPTGTGQQSAIIGSGTPSAPVISGNTLFVATSGGGLSSITIPASPTGITPTSWFKLP